MMGNRRGQLRHATMSDPMVQKQVYRPAIFIG